MAEENQEDYDTFARGNEKIENTHISTKAMFLNVDHVIKKCFI